MKAFGGSIVHELSALSGTLLHHVLLIKYFDSVVITKIHCFRKMYTSQ